MVTDQQVRKLMKLNQKGCLLVAVAKSGMSENTARKYLRHRRLSSQVKQERAWRTREDPFEEDWSQVQLKLEINPGLESKTLFEWLQRSSPGRYDRRGHSIFPLSSIYFSLLLQELKYSKDLRIHLSCKTASTSSASFSPPSTSSDKACRRTLCVSVTIIRDPNCWHRPQAFLIHAMSSEGGPVFVPPGVVSLLRP